MVLAALDAGLHATVPEVLAVLRYAELLPALAARHHLLVGRKCQAAHNTALVEMLQQPFGLPDVSAERHQLLGVNLVLTALEWASGAPAPILQLETQQFAQALLTSSVGAVKN